MEENKRFNADPFLLGLLAISLGVNVWLGLEVRRSRSLTPQAAEAKLKLGDKLPALEATDADGRAATLRASDDARPTVFYVYSHSCGWCKRNQPAIAALAGQAAERYRFVGLCMGPPQSCAKREGDPPFASYAGVKPQQVMELGLGSVPQTIVVAPSGEITRHFRGAWVMKARNEVQDYFKVELPELEPTPEQVEGAAH